MARGTRVEVITVDQTPPIREVTLLGDARAYSTATVYGKVSGYVRKIMVDKGDKVEAGQVIAEIESAEIDHQYISAIADLDNKKRLAQRQRELVRNQYASAQAGENAETGERMAAARVAELAAMKSYQVLRAPFAGTVAARFVDVGALVQNATTNQASNQPVVIISDSSRLRVYVYVEQRDAPFVHIGDMSRIADASNPSRNIRAPIARVTGELDPSTRTMLVEINVDNPNGFFLPGSFVSVTLEIPTPVYARVPSTALIMRGVDPFVAVIADDNKIRFQPVRVATTDGRQVSLMDGVVPGQRVAVNLPSSLAEGSRIQPVAVTTRR
jgi:RND family efflux transporter MFP subunit